MDRLTEWLKILAYYPLEKWWANQKDQLRYLRNCCQELQALSQLAENRTCDPDDLPGWFSKEMFEYATTDAGNKALDVWLNDVFEYEIDNALSVLEHLDEYGFMPTYQVHQTALNAAFVLDQLSLRFRGESLVKEDQEAPVAKRVGLSEELQAEKGKATLTTTDAPGTGNTHADVKLPPSIDEQLGVDPHEQQISLLPSEP